MHEEAEWGDEARLDVVLHHQVVHLVLPDLDGILLHRVKHVAEIEHPMSNT